MRRHAVLFSALALLLGVLPDLLSDAVADATTSAIPVSVSGGPDENLFDVLWCLADASADALPVLGALVLDAAVVLIALGPQRRTRLPVLTMSTIIGRMVLLALATLTADIAWVALAPRDAWEPGLVLLSLWIVALPLVVAESVSLARLPVRLWRLARGHRSGTFRLVVAYVVLDLVLSELPSPFEDGSFGYWTVEAVESALNAALALFADAVSVSLYLALRRIEDMSSPSSLVRAFD